MTSPYEPDDVAAQAATQVEPTEHSAGSQDVVRAAAELHALALPRAVEIADRVLRNALSSPRRSLPVRARAPYDFVRVSSQVITTVLREHLDSHLAGAAVGRIGLDVSRADVLEELTIELFVQYGTEIMLIADQVRLLAREALAGLLGSAEAAAGVDVAVTATHVHISDVTVGDPHLVDPADE